MQLAISNFKLGYLNVYAFFKSDSEPNCATCLELGSQLQRLIKVHALAVEVRHDSWFVGMSYPLYFPFAPASGPGVYADLVGRVVAPSVARYYRQTHTECHLFAAGTKPACETYGRREPTQ